MNTPQITFTTGGTVQAGGGFYLARQADEDLLQLCREGRFAYILTARQMGKSSLMVRTADALTAENIRAVMIDLTQIGTQVTPEQWYLGLLAMIEEQLQLATDAVAWWQANAHLGLTQRLTRFLQEVLLREITDPIVIFVDEIDTTLSLDFTDDFFAAIRSYYNARATAPEFQRLSFVLIGVATPGDLIRDPQRTPFNIGQRVDLTDFTRAEAQPLADGLQLPPADAAPVLDRVLHWTNGHPYLTQRLCQALVDERRPHWTSADVDRAVERTFFGAMSEQDNNLQFVRDMLTKRADDVEGVLTTYRAVRSDNRPVPDEEQSLNKSHLKLSGIVRRQPDGALRVSNRVYEVVFDEVWVKRHLPENWQKRLRYAAVGLLAALIIFGPVTYVYAKKNNQLKDVNRRLTEVNLQLTQVNSRLEKTNERIIKANKELEQTSSSLQDALREAKKERRRAETNAALARASAQEANLQKQIAINQRGIAEGEKKNADSQADLAKEAAERASEAEKWANTRTTQARAAEMRANEERDKADALRIKAEESQREADFQRQSAVKANKDALDALELVKATDLAAQKSVDVLRGHSNTINNVAFSPDGKFILSASEDTKAILWKVGSKDEKRGLPHNASVKQAGFSPNGKCLITVAGKGVQIWNVNSVWNSKADGLDLKPQLSLFHSANVNSAIFDFKDNFIFTADSDGEVWIWDADSTLPCREGLQASTPRKLISGKNKHTGPINKLALSPNGFYLVTASDDSTAKIWERPKNNSNLDWVLRATLKHSTDKVVAADFSPDGEQVVTASFNSDKNRPNGKARIWTWNRWISN